MNINFKRLLISTLFIAPFVVGGTYYDIKSNILNEESRVKNIELLNTKHKPTVNSIDYTNNFTNYLNPNDNIYICDEDILSCSITLDNKDFENDNTNIKIISNKNYLDKGITIKLENELDKDVKVLAFIDEYVNSISDKMNTINKNLSFNLSDDKKSITINNDNLNEYSNLNLINYFIKDKNNKKIRIEYINSKSFMNNIMEKPDALFASIKLGLLSTFPLMLLIYSLYYKASKRNNERYLENIRKKNISNDEYKKEYKEYLSNVLNDVEMTKYTYFLRDDYMIISKLIYSMDLDMIDENINFINNYFKIKPKQEINIVNKFFKENLLIQDHYPKEYLILLNNKNVYDNFFEKITQFSFNNDNNYNEKEIFNYYENVHNIKYRFNSRFLEQIFKNYSYIKTPILKNQFQNFILTIINSVYDNSDINDFKYIKEFIMKKNVKLLNNDRNNNDKEFFNKLETLLNNRILNVENKIDKEIIADHEHIFKKATIDSSNIDNLKINNNTVDKLAKNISILNDLELVNINKESIKQLKELTEYLILSGQNLEENDYSIKNILFLMDKVDTYKNISNNMSLENKNKLIDSLNELTENTIVNLLELKNNHELSMIRDVNIQTKVIKKQHK